MALANEFQQKLSQQAQEIRDKSLPGQQGPKEHPEDTMIVVNILVDDATEVEEVIPYANPRHDPRHPTAGTALDFSRMDTSIYEHTWNTGDFFEVRWDGRPHRIKPGAQRFFPRYLADHFAKGLIDFILTKREKDEKLTGLMKNRLERAKLYRQIVTGTASYYNGDVFEGERDGFRVERQVEEMNQPSAQNAFNVGEVVNPALGYGTSDKPPEKIEDEPVAPPPPVASRTEIPKSSQDLVANKSRQELMKEAKKLGLEVTPDMTKDQLSTAILNF